MTLGFFKCNWPWTLSKVTKTIFISLRSHFSHLHQPVPPNCHQTRIRPCRKLKLLNSAHPSSRQWPGSPPCDPEHLTHRWYKDDPASLGSLQIHATELVQIIKNIQKRSCLGKIKYLHPNHPLTLAALASELVKSLLDRRKVKTNQTHLPRFKSFPGLNSSPCSNEMNPHATTYWTYQITRSTAFQITISHCCQQHDWI